MHEYTDYQFRQAVPADIPSIMEIMEQAKAQMYREGKKQWDETYPALQHIENDVTRRYGYVLSINDEIAAYGALVLDGEPAYDDIDGSWLSLQPYVVLHRLAVNDKFKRKGIAAIFMRESAKFAIGKGIHSFKVDTNHDNFYMLRLLDKLGFIYCGTIQYPSGERMAFEKLI